MKFPEGPYPEIERFMKAPYTPGLTVFDGINRLNRFCKAIV